MESPRSEQSTRSRMPASRQRQGAGQAGLGRGGRAAGGAQSAAAQSHRGRSRGARGISAAARGGGTWRECRLGLALAARAVGQAQASPLCSQLRGLGLAREGEAAEEESGKPRLPAPLPPKLAGVSSRKRKSKQPGARTCRRLGAGPPAWGTAWKRGVGALEEPRPGTPRAFPQPLQHHSHRRQLGPGRDGLCSSSSLGHGGGWGRRQSQMWSSVELRCPPHLSPGKGWSSKPSSEGRSLRGGHWGYEEQPSAKPQGTTREGVMSTRPVAASPGSSELLPTGRAERATPWLPEPA